MNPRKFHFFITFHNSSFLVLFRSSVHSVLVFAWPKRVHFLLFFFASSLIFGLLTSHLLYFSHLRVYVSREPSLDFAQRKKIEEESRGCGDFVWVGRASHSGRCCRRRLRLSKEGVTTGEEGWCFTGASASLVLLICKFVVIRKALTPASSAINLVWIMIDCMNQS